MLRRKLTLAPGLEGLGQNFFKALGVFDGVGSRSRLSEQLDAGLSAEASIFFSLSIHLRYTGTSRSNLDKSVTQ